MQSLIIPAAPGAVMTWTGTDARLDCETWLDFVNFAEHAPPGPTGSRFDAEETETIPAEIAWRGTATFQEALDLARNGDPASLARMSDAVTAIKARETRELVRTLSYDVAGETPDIPRAVSGDPLNMVTRRATTRRARPIVRLLVNIGGRAGVTATQKINRGAAALALLDQLERAGQRVELQITAAAQHSNGARYAMRATVKHADEPLNLDTAAFALVNPAAQRRLDFACRCAHPTANFIRMGVAQRATPEPGQIYLDTITDEECWNRPDTAAQTVQAQYERAIDRLNAAA